MRRFFDQCPHCEGTGGLIYTRDLLRPVNCDVCFFKKTGKHYVWPERKPQKPWDEFLKETRERQARWDREREERELLKEAMKA